MFLHYLTENGNNVITDFLLKINKSDAQKISAKLIWAEQAEIFPNNFYKKFKGFDIYNLGEFIIGDYRIIASQIDKDIYLLLHVFRKQTNHTPEKETLLAMKRLTSYIYRNNKR